MGAIPLRTFTRRLRRLDREGFAQFVAALWAASGWEPDVSGAVVIALRADENVRYVFRMRQRDRDGEEGCWTIRSVALAP